MVDSPIHAVWRRLERLPAFARVADPALERWSPLDYVAAFALCAIATVIRLLADPYLPPGFPYLTYFPAVILTAFVFGTASGVFGAVICGLAAWYWFIPPVQSFTLNGQTAVALGFYAVVTVIDLGLIHFAVRAYGEQARIRTQLLRLAEDKKLVDREIDHRVKNLFALLSALVSLSQRENESAQIMGERLRGRIGAMARSHSLLRISPDGVVALEPAIREALAPFAVADAITLEGPPLKVAGDAALHLGMILHELGTNAAKYGALAAAGGTIRLGWRLEGEGEERRLCLDWAETCAEAPHGPMPTGFGSELLRRLVQGLSGDITQELAPAGLHITLAFDATRMLGPSLDPSP